MVRYTYLVVLIVLLVVGAVLPASAEVGFGVLVSWGTDTRAWSSRMVLHEEGTGRDLTPENGVIRPEPGRAILGQIIFTKDIETTQADFRFYWSTVAAPQEGDWHKAEYDAKTGYGFRIDPAQYVCSGVYDTPLQLCVWIKNEKLPHGRLFILKITFPKGGLGRDALWIRPCKPQTEVAATGPQFDMGPINDNFGKVSAAVDKLGQNQQAIVDSVNATNEAVSGLDARVARLEKWADSLTATQERTGAWTLRLPACSTGWAIWVSTGDGKPVYRTGGDYVITGCGVRYVEIAHAGERWKAWHRVEARPGQVITPEEVQ